MFIAKDVYGFITEQHMSDIELTRAAVVKKFKEGQTIQVRVLEMKVGSIVQLTHKDSLVKTNLPVLTEMDQFQKDVVTHGWINKVGESWMSGLTGDRCRRKSATSGSTTTCSAW